MSDVLDNRRPWPYDASANMFASGASCAPGGERGVQNGQGFDYTDAIVTLEYAPRADVIEDSSGSDPSSGDNAYDDENPADHEPPVTDLASESLEPYAAFQTLDYRMFRWGSADGAMLRESEAPGRLRLGTVIVRTLYQVDVLPTKAFSSVGKVNDGAYHSRWLGVSFPKETLLMMPPRCNRTIRSDGSATWTLTIAMNYDTENWNVFWNAREGEFQRIYVVGGGQYDNYEKANFSGLLF